MLYDIVLGGVLSATFIPVFVDRLANKTETRGLRFHLGRPDGVGGGAAHHDAGRAGGRAVPHRRPHRARYACRHQPGPPRPARAPGGHRVPALVRDPDRRLRPLRAGGRPAQHAPPLHRRRLGPDRQQRRLHRHPGVVRALGRARRLAGRGGAAPHPARAARAGHLARRRPPGRGADPQPAPGRPRAAALALEPARRGPARRDPAGRLDVRLRAGQPDRSVRRHHPGRQRGRPRPGVLVHLRLRLLPAALRHRRRDRDVGRDARPGAAVVHRAPGRVPAPHDRRPARRTGAHHPLGRGHPASGQALGRPAARQRSQHPGRDGDDRRGAGHVRPRACRASAPTCTSCACCSRCSAPGSPSTSIWWRTR